MGFASPSPLSPRPLFLVQDSQSSVNMFFFCLLTLSLN